MGKVILWNILLWLLVCTPTRVAGQTADFNVQLLDERNGIHTSNIRRVVRDKRGFLWILSPRYLQRFDGQTVKRFDFTDESLLDITVDHSGNVWVSTQSGTKVYVNDFTGFRNIPIETDPATKFNFLQVTSDNTVWVIGGRGLFRLDHQTLSFKAHPLPGFEDNRFYRRLFARYGDNLFMGNTHTLFSYNPLRGSLRHISFESASFIIPVSEDIIWVTDSRKRVFEVDFTTGARHLIGPERFKPGLSSPFLEILGVLPLDAVTALVSTSQGCFRYDFRKGTFQKISTSYYGTEFPVDELSASYFDERGTLWLVNQQGILLLRPLEHGFHWLKDFSRNKGGWNNSIYAIAGDSRGNIWLGTATGLVRLDVRKGKAETCYPTENSNPTDISHSIRGLAYDGRYVIFGAHAGGIQLYDPVQKRLHKPVYPAGRSGAELKQAIENDHIYGIYKLKDGNYLILADLACYLLKAGEYRLSRLEFEGADYIMQAAAQTASGHLWLGSYQGLLHLSPDFRTLHRDTLFPPHGLVSGLAIQNDTTVWAGGVGLYEVTLTSTGLQKKIIIPELKNQQITILFKDPGGRLWIGAENGLYRYTPGTRKLEWFDIWDNLQNKQFNTGSFYYSPDQRLYLGGNSGLNYFNPPLIDPREEALSVVITGITVNQDDSLFLKRNQDPLQLAWYENSVDIQFSTPYFRNPKKLRYRYRMEGLDSSWVTSGPNNTVRFSSLPPGHYTFSVATSPDGVKWYETPSPFRFHIAPPVWKRGWFIALGILLTGGSAYWLIRRRIINIKRRESRLYALQSRADSLEKEKALAMYEGLKQQLNPHFLFNSLTSLSSLIRIDRKLAGEFLDGLSRTYRYILQNREHELVPLKDEIRFAETFVGLQKTRFEEGLNVIFSVDQVRSEGLLIAPVTLQNLIENAIKHNIISPDNPLVIEITAEGDYLAVRNNKQKKNFVETSNRQGLDNLKSLYRYLSELPVAILETPDHFTVRVPLIRS